MKKKYNLTIDDNSSNDSNNDEVTSKEARFTYLVGLILSSLTKDILSEIALNALISDGLSISYIIRTPIDKIDELISKVAFHKTKAKFIIFYLFFFF